MSRDLVVVRCGRGSLHAAWRSDAPVRAFDLVRCAYEDAPPASDLPALDRVLPGPKWAGLHAFLTAWDGWRAYERVWLPDDDLETTAADVARLFERCRRLDAALAQPALTADSQWSHALTLANASFLARRTTFVEMMAPCFRRDALERLLPTFVASPDGPGWGLDDAWARVLGYRDLFVVDEVAVRHARPVGALRSRADHRAAMAGMRRTHRRFGARELRKTLAGLAPDGAWLEEADPRFLPAYLEGYARLLGAKPGARDRLLRAQAEDPAAWLRSGASAPREDDGGLRSLWRRIAPRPRRRRREDDLA